MDESVAPRPRRAWPVVVAVLAVMGLLAGGWPLLGSRLPDGQDLPVGAGVRLGPTPKEAALLSLPGDGWRLSKSASNPDQTYALRRGTVRLDASYLPLKQPSDADDLWAGQRRIGELSHSTIGASAPVYGAHGLAGESAEVTEADLTGSMTIFVHPDASYAIVLKELGRPDAAAEDRAAVRASVRGLSFAEPA